MNKDVEDYLLNHYDMIEGYGYLKKKDSYVFNALKKKLHRKYLIFRNKLDNSLRIVLALNRFDAKYLYNMRKKIEERIKTFRNVVFVTYTFSKDVSYKYAKRIISSHINNIRKRYRSYCVDYVVFVDFTKSDRIHFHVLFSTDIRYKYRRSKGRVYIEKTKIYNDMKEVYSWKHGFVDVQGVDSVTGALKYIMKYVTKLMSQKDISSVYHMCKLVYHNIRTYSMSKIKRLDKLNINLVKSNYEFISCSEKEFIIPLLGLRYNSLMLKYMSDDYIYKIIYIDVKDKKIIDMKFIEKKT